MKIFIVNEKDSTRYFLAEPEAKLHAAALLILKERIDPQYPYIVEPDEPEVPEGMLEPAQIDALPEGEIKKAARSQRKGYDLAMREYRNDLDQWNRIKKAIKEKDGKAALGILKERQDHEYEDFTIDDAEDATKL